MKISILNVDSWTTGRFMVTLDGGTSIHIDMTEDESERIRQIAVEIFMSRQKSLAREVATASPALLSDFTEVESPIEPTYVDNLDDMPF